MANLSISASRASCLSHIRYLKAGLVQSPTLKDSKSHKTTPHSELPPPKIIGIFSIKEDLAEKRKHKSTSEDACQCLCKVLQ
mmetsp:Transcript_30558/g.53705  ORF Transcript_30558/g.53705 Transcript_30558/m.53705 type:complete len:82 (-) Transcript_30558:7-252(-)